MRIVIAGPPKTGNMWLKCLLGRIYGLTWIPDQQTPTISDAAVFDEWVAAGGFPDDRIFHQHFDYSEEVAAAIAAVPAHLFTIVRDPYDAFVSQYFTLQEQAADPRLAQRGEGKLRQRDALIGKPIDHPDVLAFLSEGRFRRPLLRALGWMESGRSIVVRYEDLHADPVGSLKAATGTVAPVETVQIETALERCSPENMRAMNKGMARHVRKAIVGDSRTHLTEAHLAIFRERYTPLIRRLGYEVR